MVFQSVWFDQISSVIESRLSYEIHPRMYRWVCLGIQVLISFSLPVACVVDVFWSLVANILVKSYLGEKCLHPRDNIVTCLFPREAGAHIFGGARLRAHITCRRLCGT